MLRRASARVSSIGFPLRGSAAFSTGPRRVPAICSPSLVVFDKDGTLIDFNLMWGGWVESVAWKMEMTTKRPVREKFFDAMGYDWVARSIRSKGALCCTPMGELYAIARKVMLDEGMSVAAADVALEKVWHLPDPIETSRPLGDIPGLFLTIKQMGMKIAICTADNRGATADTMQHLGVAHMVDAMACGDDQLPAKPAPEQIWTLCHKLGVDPHNAVMVGDTSTDMRLGLNAGCGLSIGVLGGASSMDDLARDADVLIPSLAKLPKILFQYSRQAAAFETNAATHAGRLSLTPPPPTNAASPPHQLWASAP
ncbi:Aste57867_18798 [Aphanomyces stellatus]|uniref:Aste57867_18798 protein n=1 Tax=Aphanomyces stellatus TaxID=120398 RepID=A0A485LBM4_9STRA|nr:hypothetical protein As57867_018734 [Aphanomyces stellatus]VFT95532.1 Aste57867_18798 [Aphanomyces stellatus]